MRLSALSCNSSAVDVRPTWTLLNDLNAAARNADNIHDLLCPIGDGDPCACGAPGLIRELAAVLRADQAYELLEAGELGSLAA